MDNERNLTQGSSLPLGLVWGHGKQVDHNAARVAHGAGGRKLCAPDPVMLLLLGLSPNLQYETNKTPGLVIYDSNVSNAGRNLFCPKAFSHIIAEFLHS